MSLWAFRFLLFYICVLFTQPQNRFLFLYPLHIADISVVGAVGLHVMSALQNGRPIIRLGPATITALLLMFFSYLSMWIGPFMTWHGWNSHIDILYKSVIIMILIEAMAYTYPRVWAVMGTVFLGVLWWIKGGVRLIAAGATYAGERIMGPAVGLVENPNGFAYMLCVVLPIYFYFFQRSRKKLERYALLALVLTIIYIILNTGSRTGLVTLLCIAGAVTPRYGRKHKTALIVTGIAMVFLLPTIGGLNIERFKSIPESISNFMSGEERPMESLTQDEQSAQERRYKNRDTWDLITHYPILGVGINADETLMMEQWPYAVGQVHNEILMAGRQMGFIGMGLYISLLVILYRRGRLAEEALRGSSTDISDIGWTLKIQVVAIAVGGFFSPIPWNAVTFILVGTASALGNVVLESQYAAQQAMMPVRRRRPAVAG